MIYIAITLTILCIFNIATLIVLVLLMANRKTSAPIASPQKTSNDTSLDEEKLRELKLKKEAEDRAFEELMGYNAAVAYGIAQKGMNNE